MTFYLRYILTNGAEVSLPELDAALQQTDTSYELDGDLILLNGEEIGQIEINEPGDGLFEDDLALLDEFAEQKQDYDRLRSLLEQATGLVTVHVLQAASAENEPLFRWLLDNRPGLFVIEGGLFYNAAGPIE